MINDNSDREWLLKISYRVRIFLLFAFLFCCSVTGYKIAHGADLINSKVLIPTIGVLLSIMGLTLITNSIKNLKKAKKIESEKEHLDLDSISEIEGIVREYLLTLYNADFEHHELVHDVRELPYSVLKLNEALLMNISIERNSFIRNCLRDAYLKLAYWQVGVGDQPLPCKQGKWATKVEDNLSYRTRDIATIEAMVSRKHENLPVWKQLNPKN